MKTVVFVLLIAVTALPAVGQTKMDADNLEQRQPLELVFADSIVPQDRHETMLTTGGWYSRRNAVREGRLTQKVEWGVSDKLQISTFANPLHTSNSSGARTTGLGDVEIGARYTLVNAGSRYTHAALAFDAGLPSGDPTTGMGEGTYGLSPSILLSHEFRAGRAQAFSTTGFSFVVGRRPVAGAGELPTHDFFTNSGISIREDKAGSSWRARSATTAGAAETTMKSFSHPPTSGGLHPGPSCYLEFPPVLHRPPIVLASS